ncbi:MAG: hypothetical protein AAGE05_12160 [Pseudomonadota bacterium]
MTDTDTQLAEPPETAPLTGPHGGMDMTSPVDLPPFEGEEGSGLLWTSIAIAAAMAVLLLFNAAALRGWAFELAPGPESERVVALTDGWYRQTERLYLDRPVATMSGWWDAVKALQFGSDDADMVGARVGDDRNAEPRADDSHGPGFSVE